MFSEDINFDPSLISKPCFLKSFRDSLAISLSAINKKLSIASITVTFEPNLAQTLPSSRPITPAPITPSVFGTSLKFKAPVLFTIFFSSNSAALISIGDEPDAIIIFFDSNISIELSSFVISTLVPAKTFPLPDKGVTLLAANKPLIPPVNCLTISFFLCIMEARSNSTLPILMP